MPSNPNITHHKVSQTNILVPRHEKKKKNSYYYEIEFIFVCGMQRLVKYQHCI